MQPATALNFFVEYDVVKLSGTFFVVPSKWIVGILTHTVSATEMRHRSCGTNGKEPKPPQMWSHLLDGGVRC